MEGDKGNICFRSVKRSAVQSSLMKLRKKGRGLSPALPKIPQVHVHKHVHANTSSRDLGDTC